MEYQVKAFLPPSLSEFLRGYLECAEWCGLDEDQREAFELAARAHWTNAALIQARNECEEFQEDQADALAAYYAAGYDESQAGHDFYLTRNRHGAGFWDRAAESARALTTAAHVWESADVEFDEQNELLSWR